eukprot:UN27436
MLGCSSKCMHPESELTIRESAMLHGFSDVLNETSHSKLAFSSFMTALKINLVSLPKEKELNRLGKLDEK